MIKVNASGHACRDHAQDAPLQRVQAKGASLYCREPRRRSDINAMASLRGPKQMRWKISHGGHHDPRQIDLVVALALVILIVAACRFFSVGNDRPSNTTLIVPSQSMRW
ncbi:MAG TPA: hypothetical protein VN065_16900 [Bradyrhizobium sp.]|nr:hypothetical protein [Bradyrhizobium sp.]